MGKGKTFASYLASIQDRTERFRDPVHGFIRLLPEEVHIVDTAWFQRLRRIKQLGPTCWVYHGAEHSRFGHSLGVTHLASEVLLRLVRRHPELERDWGAGRLARCYRLLRLWALLHDIGHPPFSHAAEELFPPGTGHESYGARIVSTDEAIARGVDEVGAALQRTFGTSSAINHTMLADLMVGKVAEPPELLLKQIMSSELDADKMDYLLRDSLYCGVVYGHYDIERLLDSLTLHKISNKPGGRYRLAVDEGGVHVVETFVIARYAMFMQVYFHRTRRMCDHTLARYLRDEILQTTFPTDLQAYRELDDAYVSARLLASTNPWAARIRERRLYPRAFEYPVTMGREEGNVARVIRTAIEREFSSDPDKVICDLASRMAHTFGFPTEVGVDQETAIVLRWRDGKIGNLIESSPLLRRMTGRYDILRVYADESIKPQVEKTCEGLYRSYVGE